MIDLQKQSHISKFNTQLSHPSILADITSIRIKQLQSQCWLPVSPLISWSHSSLRNKHFPYSLIAKTLSLMQSMNISFIPSTVDQNRITGGSLPLLDIFNDFYFAHDTHHSLKLRSTMFLSQVTSTEGDTLLRW